MYEELCRLCLKITCELTPIFADGSTIRDTIMTCIPIEISDMDEYPKHICSKCEKRLYNAFEFRKMCQTSNEFLRQTISTRTHLGEQECNQVDKLFSENENSNDSVNVVFINVAHSYCETVFKEPIKNETVVCNFDNSKNQNPILNQNPIGNKQKLSLLGVPTNKTHCIKGSDGEKEKEKKLIHKCFLCSDIFPTKNELKHHKATHSPPFLCRFCGRELGSLQTQFRHEKRHQLDNPGFDCEFCGMKLLSRGGLRSHISVHTGSNIIECDICCKQVSRKNLKRHKLSHMGARPFPCTLCEKNFTRSAYLKIHMDKHHNSNNPHKSPFCDYTTLRIRELWRHKDLCNSSSVRMKSKMCLKMQQSKEETKIKCEQFLCNFCGKAFATKANLCTHEFIHTGQRPFNCSSCNKCFRTKLALIRHERIHTGERPYKCKVCTKSFNQNTHLKKHLVLHSGNKNFACNLCDKKFYQSDALRYHVMTHTGERPFLCTICDKGFYIKYRLKVHMSKFHKISDISTIDENK